MKIGLLKNILLIVGIIFLGIGAIFTYLGIDTWNIDNLFWFISVAYVSNGAILWLLVKQGLLKKDDKIK